MNTLPFAQIGMWGFSLVSLFTLCLGGLGVLDQGADFTWRDSDVLVRFFFPFFFLSFSYWDSVSRTNMCLLHSVWEGPLHCRKVEKRSRTLFCRCMQSAWYVKNGIQHTHTHRLGDLEAALRWAQGRCPRVLLGLDRNGHSPWWGPATVITTPVGAMIEDFIVDHDLEVLNDCHSAPSFVSDMGARTWIDITLATRSLALSLFTWRVDSEFFAGSDHRPIFFTLDSTPL